ncbi:MAG: UDP-N-acetylmuramate--L-alanine ligase [Spirochaetota bacterium]|jgi:UDP-N-acetylmuramate--alanine ligase|nr:UDP-N-acetylmuramate--L-alanine ligase [Spirochaetota bacterium]
MTNTIRRLHFIGIGGIGMSGIAELFHNLGYPVSGSDLAESAVTERLRAMGIPIALGHSAENLGGAEVVVYSAAVPLTNPEMDAARERRLPLIPRAEMLNELTRLKTSLAVAGTHGKTTTSSMLAEIFAQAGLDPTCVIGGKLSSIESNARLGSGEYIIFEACEAFGSFRFFSPTSLILTNIDSDHLEYYETMDGLRNAFLNFVNCVPFYGMAIVNNDDENVRMLFDHATKRLVTYGIDSESAYMAKNIQFQDWSSTFDVYMKNQKCGSVALPLPGKHNISNALGAAALALEHGVAFQDIARALAKFVNADRRFQIKGTKCGITVVDDYAHHPSEIAATILAAKQRPGQRVIAVFQPHLYSRTLALYPDFAGALALADEVLLAPVYPAREKPIPGVSSQLIADSLRKRQYAVTMVEDAHSCFAALGSLAQPNDLVLFMGAGNIWQWAEEYLAV